MGKNQNKFLPLSSPRTQRENIELRITNLELKEKIRPRMNTKKAGIYLTADTLGTSNTDFKKEKN